MRSLIPDLAILHVQKADREGNAHVWGNLGVIREAAFAAKKVMLTCEEIVEHEEILRDPNRTVIPGFLVSSVVHEPMGSHPSPTLGYLRRDDDFYFDFHMQSRSRNGFLQWLEDWITGVHDHPCYLERLGRERLGRLKPSTDLMSPMVNFSV